MFPVGKMCEVLQVSRSGFYHWMQEKLMIRLQLRKLLSSEIYGIYHWSRDRYGSPRITKELEAKLDGYMTYSRKYGVDYGVQGKATGIYYQYVIFFSGLKGKIFQKLEIYALR